ncbi:hypothetical protein FRB90_011584 [Tulasnella sp. 427]|nr:hypothetical protein FRB90_011584 [Tulasnella sp. 427]
MNAFRIILQDFSRRATKAPDVVQTSGETHKRGTPKPSRRVWSGWKVSYLRGASSRVILGVVEAIKVEQSSCEVYSDVQRVRYPKVLRSASRESIAPSFFASSSKQCTLKYSSMARIEEYTEEATKKSQTTRNQDKKRARPAVVSAYLFLYNTASSLAWFYLLVIITLHLSGISKSAVENHLPLSTHQYLRGGLLPLKLAYGPANPIGKYSWAPEWAVPILERASTLYMVIGPVVKWIQTGALLEVVHSALGWVRSPLTTTVMQVASRIIVVWGITDQYPSTHSNPFYASMVLAWSLTEVIRYAFYACNILELEPYPLLWIRYTTFYILYPTGAPSEAFLMFSTLPFSVAAPRFNLGAFTLDNWIVLGLYSIWWPSLYSLYTYMIKQRRKVLGGPRKKIE